MSTPRLEGFSMPPEWAPHECTWMEFPPANKEFAADPAELAATPEQIAAHQRLVDQAVKTFGSQHYDHYTFLLSITDQLGGIGIALGALGITVSLGFTVPIALSFPLTNDIFVNFDNSTSPLSPFLRCIGTSDAITRIEAKFSYCPPCETGGGDAAASFVYTSVPFAIVDGATHDFVCLRFFNGSPLAEKARCSLRGKSFQIFYVKL